MNTRVVPTLGGGVILAEALCKGCGASSADGWEILYGLCKPCREEWSWRPGDKAQVSE